MNGTPNGELDMHRQSRLDRRREGSRIEKEIFLSRWRTLEAGGRWQIPGMS